jgi:membrane protease YdiL (CAAX protease family)
MSADPTPHASQPLFARVFLSPDEPRLRAGWRLLVQSLLTLALLLAFSLPITIGLMLLGQAGPEILQTSLLLNSLVSFLGIVASVWIARKFLDRRSFTSLGLAANITAMKDLAAGIGIAALMMAVMLALELAVGWTRFEGWAWQSLSLGRVAFDLLGALAVFIAVGFQEEILSRGYHLQNIRDGINVVWGIALSSAVFAILHVWNPHAVWYTTVLGLFGAGLFLAYGWYRSRALWLPIGLHIGWNFFEGPVLGFPVSGLDTSRLIMHTVTGPRLWTGGAFGPEAGLILVPALSLGTLLVWAYTRRLRSPGPTPSSPG